MRLFLPFPSVEYITNSEVVISSCVSFSLLLLLLLFQFATGHSRSMCAFAQRGPVVASPSRDAFPSTLRWFENGCSLSLQLPDFPPQILLGFPKFLLKPPKQLILFTLGKREVVIG